MKYDFKLELDSKNNSLTKIIERLKEHSEVLEFGCANGRLTKYLNQEMNCMVTIVEIDEEAGKDAAPYSKLALLGKDKGDIESYNWCQELADKKFDFIIFADVLEHLIAPEETLSKAKKFLKPNGSILVSIPNIANNAIVANLYLGEFKYTDIGLLDRTHVSFFTKSSFCNLVKKLGYHMYYMSATYSGINKNEVKVNQDKITADFTRLLNERENGDAYQLIFEFGNEDRGSIDLDYNENSSISFCTSMFFKHNSDNDYDIDHVIQKNIGINGHLTYVLEWKQPVNSIRFDPMETNGIVRIRHILINQQDYFKSIEGNYSVKLGNLLLFKNRDPMIFIALPDLIKAEIDIEYDILDFDIYKSPYKEEITDSIIKNYASLIKHFSDKQMELSSLKKTTNEQETLINDLASQLSVSNIRLNAIKKRATVLWKWLDKYNPLNYSRDIDYCIDQVDISVFRMKIKGWVISYKSDPVSVKGRPFIKIRREIRNDVNRVKHMPDNYLSGFEISACPVLPLHLKFKSDDQNNIYFVNGTKLYVKYLKGIYAKFTKSIKKRGFYRTLLLSWYTAIGKKHLYADSYDQWFASHKASEEELRRQRETTFKYQPLISIVIPTFNTPVKFLVELMESIQKQTYRKWELCIADGNSTNKKTIKKLKEFMQIPNVKVNFLEKNYMISGNTNEGLKMAEGEFVALMDHDDLIEPNALFEFVNLLNEDPKLDFIYSDEDKVSNNGKHFMVPHFKPDFSIDNLRSANYITHFVCIRKSILDKVGPFDSKCDGAQDYDMFLRIVDVTNHIGHIPKILYHWRVTDKSTARAAANKPYVVEAGKYALRKHLERNSLQGTVKDGLVPTFYKIDYEIINEPKISILIASKDHIEDLDKCIKSIINKTTYKNYEIIVIENNSVEDETFKYYEKLKNNHNIKVVYWKDEFNYSAINNYGVKYATGEYILLLNNDIEVITPNWLEEMLMIAQRKDVGAVGAKLFYSDNTIQHAGVIIGIGGIAGHSHRFYPSDNVGYVGRLIITQNLSAVTAACLMVKKSIYFEVNGLTEKYKVAFNDIDFCLKIRKLGYLNVMTPYAQLYHYESKSRGYEDTVEKQERFLGEQNMFREDWKEILEQGDPYYNPNLTLVAEDFSLKQ